MTVVLFLADRCMLVALVFTWCRVGDAGTDLVVIIPTCFPLAVPITFSSVVPDLLMS